MSQQRRRIFLGRACFAVYPLMLVASTGCTLFRNVGTGQHLDAPREHISTKKANNQRDMIVEVTTDASGEVVSVKFIRSSGADTVDNYVADSIRGNWPQIPSKITDAELTYSMANGFSQPRVLSSRPAP